MEFLYAFLVGGLICLLAQAIMDAFNLLPVHVTSIFVLIGSILNIGNIYDKLIEFAGCGASIPISSFGHSLTHAAITKANEVGYIGIITGMFDMTSSGITMAIVFAFFCSLVFKSRG